MHRTRTKRLYAAGTAAVLLLSACSGAKAPRAGGAPSDAPGGTDEVVADASSAPSAAASAAASAPAAGGGASTKPGTTRPGTTTRPGSGAAAAPGTPANPGTGRTTRTDRSVTLYSGADNTLGIDNDSITMCAHAALIYGAAFDTSADDFDVYWSALNDAGGIFGRKVDVTYEDDKYTPTDAIAAATRCKSKDPFLLLGGIGFDQIPAVRNWAEDNKQLYLHHAATVKGSEGKRYSYTTLPTVEKLGEMFAELAVSKFKGKKIGILHRDSVNWDPGYEAFKAVAKAKGLNIVAEAKTQNDHNHLQRVLTVKDAGAEVVWLWENAVVAAEVIGTADAQDYRPQWMAFPFNLTTQTVQRAGIRPNMLGVAAWPAYSYRDYSGPFAAYADDMRLFEAQYAKYRPDADLQGLGGDLLFLNWVGQKALHQMFLACGKDCTRNKFASLMHNGYTATAQGCRIDFTRNPYRGSYQVNIFDTYDSPSGFRNWRPLSLCRERL